MVTRVKREMTILQRVMTTAGRRLTEWMQRLEPERRLTLGLTPPEPAPYLPNNRARVARRKARRHIVQASRRVNRQRGQS